MGNIHANNDDNYILENNKKNWNTCVCGLQYDLGDFFSRMLILKIANLKSRGNPSFQHGNTFKTL